jgi:benzoyl-CoA reductase subunit A
MSKHVSVDEKTYLTRGRTIVAGIDVGAVSSKAMILLDGQPYGSSLVATRTPKESAWSALNTALAETGLEPQSISCIVATGRGRAQVSFANKAISEITCGAAGAVRVWGPSVRALLDAGGESCRVIHCTEEGSATDFLWNDKCAAGIGRSLESFSGLVGRDVTEIGKISLQCEPAQKLSDFCPVYAQSEALDLIRSKAPPEQIIAAYHHAMARRISTLVARLGVKKDFVIIGGLARNPGITDRIESILNIGRLSPKIDWDPALTVALGAALLAQTLRRERQPDW